MMNASRFRLLITAILAVVISPTFSWSATTPIAAKAVHVEGEATVLSIVDSQSHKIEVGTEFREGDRVQTAKNGVVEIEFDTGDLIRIDKDTDMTIKSLNRDEKGSTFSIFSLIAGRVKSAVSKLATSESKFEYHTKAAICGVSGTPPFVVGALMNRTSVDLLGKKGEPGSVYVRGFDASQTLVTVMSGFRTIVFLGQAPQKPFEISASRFRNLNKTIPFFIKPKREREKQGNGAAPAEEKKKEEGKPAEKPDGKQEKQPDTQPKGEPQSRQQPGGGGMSSSESMVMNNLSRNVSVPRQTAPDQTKTVQGVENQTTQDQGIIGQKSGSSGDSEPPVTTTTLDVVIDLK